MKISEMNCPPLLNEIKVLKNKIKKKWKQKIKYWIKNQTSLLR